jgi:hypothetical protein
MRSVVNVSRDAGNTYNDENAGTWDKERFPKSRQMFRPMWSYTKRQWGLKGYDKNSKELNDLVAGCKLKYKPGHPMQGQFIKDADITDFGDAFFNHKQLKVLAQEGDTLLDKERPFDQLILAGLLMNPEFQYQSSEDTGSQPVSNKIRYLIVDKGKELDSKKIAREREHEAYELFKGLNDQKKLAIAVSLNLIRDEKTDRAIIDDVLWDFAKSKDKAKDTYLSKQEIFIEMCNLKTDKLATQHTIGRAKGAGFLKKTKQGWMLFGQVIGKTDKDVETYFNDVDNSDTQEVIAQLEQQLENIKD